MTETRYARGTTATLDAFFRVGASGALTDADPVTIDIRDPDDVEVVSNAVPTSNPSTGVYTFDYEIAEAAKLGVWTATWTGIVNAAPATNDDKFEVVEAGSVAFTGDTFATVDELATFLDLEEVAEDDPKAVLALRLATGIIQRECKHRIFLYTDDVKKIHGTYGENLYLPEPPVLSVSELTDGEDEVALTAFSVSRHGHLTRDGYWAGGEVTVTYTHGFDPIPDDIKALCLQVASRAYNAQSISVGSETIGGYSYSAGEGASSGSLLTEEERRLCRAYWPVLV